MAVDKGVTKVITNAQDGKAYFKYPLGVIPADATYDDMRVLSGQAGDSYYLNATNFRINGTFDWSATDPNGNGDDGGIVIASSNGWWVRQFSYDINNPIELDWYELADQADIAPILEQIVGAQAPSFYVKVPSLATELTCSHNNYQWPGITNFALIESAAQVTIRFSDDTSTENWAITPSDVFVLGTTTKAASRDDYTLTLQGSWRWDNKLISDSSPTGIALSVPMVRVSPSGTATAPAALVVIRCNTKYPQSSAFSLTGYRNADRYISGKNQFGGGFYVGGESNGTCVFEDLYCSDELGRGNGWDGSPTGDSSYVGRHTRGCQTTLATTGNTENIKFTGKITTQYGQAHYGLFYVKWAGTSLDDPLELVTKDCGWSGPNDEGFDVGVELSTSDFIAHGPGKSDAWAVAGQEVDGRRFVKRTMENQWGINTKWANYAWFMENNLSDTGPTVGVKTKYIDYILTNLDGNVYYKNGGSASLDEISDIRFYGDGVNPANVQGNHAVSSRVEMVLDSVCRYGQFHDIMITTALQYTGEPIYAFGSGNTIQDCSLMGRVYVRNSKVDGDDTSQTECGTNYITHVKFLGTAREVINIEAPAHFVISDISAPAGSTIAGTGTCTVNGVSKSLPYDILPGDSTSTPVLDIPFNPLLSA